MLWIILMIITIILILLILWLSIGKASRFLYDKLNYKRWVAYIPFYRSYILYKKCYSPVVWWAWQIWYLVLIIANIMVFFVCIEIQSPHILLGFFLLSVVLTALFKSISSVKYQFYLNLSFSDPDKTFSKMMKWNVAGEVFDEGVPNYVFRIGGLVKYFKWLNSFKRSDKEYLGNKYYEYKENHKQYKKYNKGWNL